MPTTERKPIGVKRRKGLSFGEKLIAGIQEVVEVLESGGMEAVEHQFTIHRVRRIPFDKPTLTAEEVVAIRSSLGASQVVFADLLGVSPNTVRAWEQGVNLPSGIALRFLAEIGRDPSYWKARMSESFERKISGPGASPKTR